MPKTSSMPGLRRGARLASLLAGLLTGGGVLLAMAFAQGRFLPGPAVLGGFLFVAGLLTRRPTRSKLGRR